MAKKRQRTERDRISDANKTLTSLLLWEATGGTIPLPKGVENYSPPAIPFAERRALIDSVNKQLAVDMKINPESEESVFDTMKEELKNERKRDSTKSGNRGISSFPKGNGITYQPDPDDDSAADDDHSGLV